MKCCESQGRNELFENPERGYSIPTGLGVTPREAVVWGIFDRKQKTQGRSQRSYLQYALGFFFIYRGGRVIEECILRIGLRGWPNRCARKYVCDFRKTSQGCDMLLSRPVALKPPRSFRLDTYSWGKERSPDQDLEVELDRFDTWIKVASVGTDSGDGSRIWKGKKMFKTGLFGAARIQEGYSSAHIVIKAGQAEPLPLTTPVGIAEEW